MSVSRSVSVCRRNARNSILNLDSAYACASLPLPISPQGQEASKPVNKSFNRQLLLTLSHTPHPYMQIHD